jgi:hypothetical protein
LLLLALGAGNLAPGAEHVEAREFGYCHPRQARLPGRQCAYINLQFAFSNISKVLLGFLRPTKRVGLIENHLGRL